MAKKEDMILGIPTGIFTALHVLISLTGLLSGAVALLAMLKNQPARIWTATFLISTIATSVTGFLFHTKFGPAHVIGVISLAVLAVAVAALYGFKLAGRSRWVYVVTATMSLYLNVFVAVVQAFQKVPVLHAFAPSQTEPPFAIVQGVVLVAFVALAVLALRRFHPFHNAAALTWSGDNALPLG